MSFVKDLALLFTLGAQYTCSKAFYFIVFFFHINDMVSNISFPKLPSNSDKIRVSVCFCNNVLVKYC